MAISMTVCGGQFPLIDRSLPPDAQDGSPRQKLDRLRELRAVIETLRHEREAQDPLLVWVVERERVEIQRRD